MARAAERGVRGRRWRRRVAGWIAYPVYRVGAWCARVVPGGAVPSASRGFGALACALMPRRRRLVRRHLLRVRGSAPAPRDLRRSVVETFRSYARYWLDTFRLGPETASAFVARFDARGVEHLDRALARGRGAILVVPHLGSFDVGGAWLASRGYRVSTVAERLGSPALFAWFTARRRALGMEVIPLGPGALAALEAALRQGGVVGLICDRDLGRRGVDVRFFGEPTTLPAGPARLALSVGAPILPAAVYQAGDRYLVLIRPELRLERTGREREDVARLTQAIADELELLIRLAPEQWHLMQPNWPSDERR